MISSMISSGMNSRWTADEDMVVEVRMMMLVEGVLR